MRLADLKLQVQDQEAYIHQLQQQDFES
jgi:hypothetical protein